MVFSNCCCGALSLRSGTGVLAALLLLNGTLEIFMYARYLGLLGVAVGGVGCYAVYSKQVMAAKVYYFSVVVAFLVAICHFLYYTRWNKPNSPEFAKQQCTLADDPAVCQDLLENMTSFQMELFSWFTVVSMLVVYAWCTLVAYSYHEVLAVGGSGDEKKSASELSGPEAKKLWKKSGP